MPHRKKAPILGLIKSEKNMLNRLTYIAKKNKNLFVLWFLTAFARFNRKTMFFLLYKILCETIRKMEETA